MAVLLERRNALGVTILSRYECDETLNAQCPFSGYES